MKVYLDTSVFGGVFDEIFKEETILFFKYLREEDIQLVYSDITERELERSPQRVQHVFHNLKEEMDYVQLNEEAKVLAREYIKEGALTEKCREDPQHIAIASIHRVDVLVSWNFKHMVNFILIRKYNAMNLQVGYSTIDIRSPKEILP